ncbi:UDP-glucuronosyl and UDP-glucosyl transferase [Handroanthus impetiginosus]|uniref:Glycosyltransferase n=1 Tax=Handroanthus impetiginosus TaxID=429701 RepID=A0A2G9GFG3_9LAMI|nr:UDP-glucuronosyl and UDP-glucosyl transferase [Handroanthus impetiginosus]
MEKEQSKFTILMFPWLAYSHVLPFLELSKRLSKRNFYIYFCSSSVNLDSIKNNVQKDLSSDASIDLIELHVPSLPQLPPKFHTTKNLPQNLFPILLKAFQMSTSSFSEILNNLKPDLLVYDFFQPWAPKLASSQGIPSIYFATSGAAAFSFYYHMYTYGSTAAFPYQEIYLLDHEKVDVRAPIEPMVKEAEEDFAFGNFRLSSGIVLIKSLNGIGGKYIEYLSVLSQKKVVPTGPLLQEFNENDDENDEKSLEILQWLSKRDPFSTVFVCFGSETFLSNEQILEIAKGLELCETNFIWVVKFSTVCIEEALLEGFLGRVKERGLVLKEWAPQAKILSHSSIGGFVSHCGWSSIMESIYYGVPIIALPMKFDQPINARLVVDIGAGMEVERGENGQFCGEEVAKAINMVLMGKNGEDLRLRVRNLREKMKKEEEERVSEVVEELSLLCNKSKGGVI